MSCLEQGILFAGIRRGKMKEHGISHVDLVVVMAVIGVLIV